MRLEKKVAIVTGGGRGIGRGIALRLAIEGATVVIAQRDPASGEQTAETIREGGHEACYIQTDVSQAEQVDRLIAQTLDRYGPIHILVNNAGITGSNGPFLDMPLSTWQHIIHVNLTGMFLCGQRVARTMVQHKIQGRIVNVGSVNSYAAEKEGAAYVTSKGGVLLLTKAMAVELAPYGIIVNCIAPGPIRVDKNESLIDSEPTRTAIAKGVPLGRAGLPEEVAAAAVFYASDECTFVTGTSLLVDGGFRAYNRFD